jgi:hypothetical protein
VDDELPAVSFLEPPDPLLELAESDELFSELDEVFSELPLSDDDDVAVDFRAPRLSFL